MKIIAYAEFFNRLLSATDIKCQTDLARALGVHRSAVTQAKTRDAIPHKWVLQLARHFSLSPDWLEFGTGSPTGGMRRVPRERGVPGAARSAGRGRKQLPAPGAVLQGNSGQAVTDVWDIVQVPKVAARLCAGGGSFEVEAQPVSAYPFPRWWLAKLGSPSDMVFMDVVGDSMEPSICDGDTVLVEQGRARIDNHSVLAVGLADAIYLKRVERCGDGLILHSDNPAYAPMEVFGDELEHFRVIGRVVWLCRDCR